MGGQSTWNDPGAATNAYVVTPEIVSGIYYESTYRTLFGKLNANREVSTTKIIHGADEKTIDAGNDSPVWEKTNTENAEVRFVMREENKGMATYGEADVKPGDFAQYMHTVCYVRQVDSPAYPVVGVESEENFKRVVRDLVKVEKSNIARWRAKEVDLDAFRTLYMGASRGLLLNKDGGRGISLYGGSAGQHRSCWNTYVAGESGLTTPSANLATHESTLAALLAGLSNNSNYAFTYDTHELISHYVDELLDGDGLHVFGREYRAIALIDERNMYRLTTVGGTLSNLFKDARERSAKNPALYHRKALELDDILYIPAKQMAFFRPSTDGTSITYGCGMDKDPRSDSFSNTSNITTTIVLTRGALLRGRRKGVTFTTDFGKHGKGSSYAVHYHDGWTRREWFAKDSRTKMKNHSSLVVFNYDPGVKKDFES